jgi:hypothetical protein
MANFTIWGVIYMPRYNSIMARPTKFSVIKIIVSHNISAKLKNTWVTHIAVKQFLMNKMRESSRWLFGFFGYLGCSFKLNKSRGLVRRRIQIETKNKNQDKRQKI